MALYYDERIRPTVVERWAAAATTNMDVVHSETPEDHVNPEDSALLKDMKIPLTFKNQIAQELYNVEAEAIKDLVRLKHKVDLFVRTVYNTSKEDRLELVRDYQK